MMYQIIHDISAHNHTITHNHNIPIHNHNTVALSNHVHNLSHNHNVNQHTHEMSHEHNQNFANDSQIINKLQNQHNDLANTATTLNLAGRRNGNKKEVKGENISNRHLTNQVIAGIQTNVSNVSGIIQNNNFTSLNTAVELDITI